MQPRRLSFMVIWKSPWERVAEISQGSGKFLTLIISTRVVPKNAVFWACSGLTLYEFSKANYLRLLPKLLDHRWSSVFAYSTWLLSHASKPGSSHFFRSRSFRETLQLPGIATSIFYIRTYNRHLVWRDDCNYYGYRFTIWNRSRMLTLLDRDLQMKFYRRR